MAAAPGGDANLPPPTIGQLTPNWHRFTWAGAEGGSAANDGGGRFSRLQVIVCLQGTGCIESTDADMGRKGEHCNYK